MRRASARPVRACSLGSGTLFRMSHTWNSTLHTSLFTLHTWHFTLHSSHFTLHSHTSDSTLHLISNELFWPHHLFSSHHICHLSSSQLFSSRLRIAQPFSSHWSFSYFITALVYVRKVVLSKMDSYTHFAHRNFWHKQMCWHKWVCTEAFTRRTLLHHTRRSFSRETLLHTEWQQIAQCTCWYNFPSSNHFPVYTTLYYKPCTKHFYHKACTSYFLALLCTANLAQCTASY